MEIGDRRFKDAGADATENVPPRPDSWNFLMRDSHALIASKMNLQSFLCETPECSIGPAGPTLGGGHTGPYLVERGPPLAEDIVAPPRRRDPGKVDAENRASEIV